MRLFANAIRKKAEGFSRVFTIWFAGHLNNCRGRLDRNNLLRLLGLGIFLLRVTVWQVVVPSLDERSRCEHRIVDAHALLQSPRRDDRSSEGNVCSSWLGH